mgnify:CR=1 FL=1|tara:strand:- start:61 stop:492 length:432 start_codon:yes stop_codon:yes gene_type:complete
MLKLFFLAFIGCLLLSGCTKNGIPLMSSSISGTEGLPPEQLSFAKFKDIPIPDGAVMDMKDTIIFGSDEEWFGRLTIIPNLSHAETFDFFRFEMPNLSWEEITNVRATSSVLSYQKNQRVVTIQIFNSYGKTVCSINMSPKKQ